MSQPCTLKTSSSEHLVFYRVMDYISIYDFALSLRAYRYGICHEIIDKAGIALSVTVSSGKGCGINDLAGGTGKVYLVEDVLCHLFIIKTIVVVVHSDPLTQSLMDGFSEGIV